MSTFVRYSVYRFCSEAMFTFCEVGLRYDTSPRRMADKSIGQMVFV